MRQKTVTTSLAPKVSILDARGNLQVKGWDRPEVLLRASTDEITLLEEQADEVQIRCTGDCVVRLPYEAVIEAEVIQGNARFKLLEGKLQIESVSGSLELRNIRSAQIGTVGGNLLAKQVTQDLSAEKVQGSAIARDIHGECSLPQIGGNLDLRDAEEDIDAAAGGNIRIRLSLLVGHSYRARAGGNLHCQIPLDSSLKADLTSSARRIQIKRPDGKTTLAEEKHTLTLGEGESSMELKAGGSILFVCQEGDWAEKDEDLGELDDAFAEFSEEFGQQVTDQIETQIEAQMEILNENLAKLEAMIGASGIPPEEANRVMQRARQASERANARAQERMRRAEAKLERKLQAAQRKAELKMRATERRSQGSKRAAWSFEWASAPSPSGGPGPAEAPTDEERLLILRMLEEKKISLEEAEELLAALEGK